MRELPFPDSRTVPAHQRVPLLRYLREFDRSRVGYHDDVLHEPYTGTVIGFVLLSWHGFVQTYPSHLISIFPFDPWT